MSFWKSFAPEFRDLLLKQKLIGVKYLRLLTTKGSILEGPCKADKKCKDDHPPPRSLAEAKRDFPFYKLIKFNDEVCCDVDCPDLPFPSFDECMYKESDKNKRNYQVTWVECPIVQIKPKKICCFEAERRPPVQRRPPKLRPNTACKVERECADVSECPKVKSPRCRRVRSPPKCTTEPVMVDCKKIRTPYPSFSECNKPKQREKRRTECLCSEMAPMCYIVKEFVKWESRGKQSLSPCKKR